MDDFFKKEKILSEKIQQEIDEILKKNNCSLSNAIATLMSMAIGYLNYIDDEDVKKNALFKISFLMLSVIEKIESQ